MSVSVLKRSFQGIRVIVESSRSFDQVLQSLRELTKAASIPQIVALAKEAASEEDYVKQVQEKFVGQSGFMLFAELDHGGWLARFGIRRRSVRWILGNPLIAITMLRQDISAGLFVPIELLLTESESRKSATLTYVLPSSLIAIEPGPSALREAAEVLDAKFEAFVAAATNV